MGILDSVSKPGDRPVLVTICGDSGMGKTTLATTFPKPIVIRAEDGLRLFRRTSVPIRFRFYLVPKTFGSSARG